MMTASYRLHVSGTLAAIVAVSLIAPAPADAEPARPPAGLQIADARNVRHCHNTPRRTYCHTREQLPVTVRPSALNGPAGYLTCAP